MRLNVYSQELTGEVLHVEQIDDNGQAYHGVRFVLASSDRLHHTEDDDDRSAVTFWLPDHESRYSHLLHDTLEQAAGLCSTITLATEVAAATTTLRGQADDKGKWVVLLAESRVDVEAARWVVDDPGELLFYDDDGDKPVAAFSRGTWIGVITKGTWAS